MTRRMRENLFSLFFARFTTMLGVGVLLVVIPVYLTRMKGSIVLLGLTMSVYGVVAAVLEPLIGRMIDTINKKRVLIWGLLGSAAAMLLLAVTVNTNQVIAIRALQGITSAMIFPSSLTIVAEHAPSEKRGSIMGMYGSSISAGLALGPLIAGVLIERMSLAAPLYLSAVLSVLSAVLVFLSLGSRRVSAVI